MTLFLELPPGAGRVEQGTQQMSCCLPIIPPPSELILQIPYSSRVDLNSFNLRTNLVVISCVHFSMNLFLIIFVVEKTWMVTIRDYAGKGTQATSSPLLRIFMCLQRFVVQPQGCVDGNRALITKLVLCDWSYGELQAGR